MIDPVSYQKAWIMSHRNRKGFEKINPPLAEKMIHALGLVEQLSVHGLNFVFKGGTSLVLLLGENGRFSIDIDIITTASREEIESTLEKVCNAQPFKTFVLSEHRSYQPGIPKAHYSLVYNSALMNREDRILLDILFDEHTYPQTLELPIQAEWLATVPPTAMVKVPSVESITGDKLTAFAPQTTGIPYGKGKEVEIVKQLYDLGKLFSAATDMNVIRNSFERTVQKEMAYRGSKCNQEDVIQDIINTGLLIARRGKEQQEPQISHFKEIERGLLQFKAYSTTSFFRIDEAITAAAKAALLAARIGAGDTSSLPKYESTFKKADFLITDTTYNFLNKLLAEPLFYWHHTLKLLQQPKDINII